MCKPNCQNNCNKCPIQSKSPVMSKVVSDLVNTVIMLHNEHEQELIDVLVNDKTLHESLSKVEFILWQTRQQRK